MIAPTKTGCRARDSRAFTMIEAVVSIAIVALLAVGALQAMGALVGSQIQIRDRASGQSLAIDLMAEILATSYEEPDDAPSFGRESGESGTDRTGYDDVDDFFGWSSTPPENPDGTTIPGLDTWTRSVDVVWVDPSDVTTVAGTESGIKRVTVTVSQNGTVMGELTAIRTNAFWDQSEAGGDGLLVLLVSTMMGPSPITEDQDRITLLESWGFNVEFMDASVSDTVLDAAAARSDVVYVSAEVDPFALGTRLTDAAVGVVNECGELNDDFEFSSGTQNKTRDEIRILDNTHYVTSHFASTGYHQICTSLQSFTALEGSEWTLTVLADTYNTGNDSNNKPSLTLIETGGDLLGGGTAADRRVSVPWANSSFDINALNADGQMVLRRALEWAAGMEQP